MFGQWLTNKADAGLRREVARLSVEVLDLRADIESRDRQIRIRDAEIESLAQVVARDRARVQAETASATYERAKHEGTK